MCMGSTHTIGCILREINIPQLAGAERIHIADIGGPSKTQSLTGDGIQGDI